MAEEAEDFLGNRTVIHDHNQFEMKLDYEVNPEQKQNRYLVECYFFIPSSLVINQENYSKEKFYSDMQAFIRFKTPLLSLEKLVDEKNERSPFNQLRAPLDQFHNGKGNRDSEEIIRHEIRMLGCMFNSFIRDQVLNIINQLATFRQSKTLNPLEADILQFASELVTEGGQVLQKFRRLRVEFLDSVIPPNLRDSFEHINEYLSLSFEKGLTELYKEISRKSLLPKDLIERLGEQIKHEYHYRKSIGYRSFITLGTANEEYIFRKKALKKYVLSVLYLDIRKVAESWAFSDLGASVAAGVAMLFAVLVAVWSQITFGPTSLPFIAIAVLAYIIKDRLKDWLKIFFNQKMTDYLYDYRIKILDPLTKEALGECREAVSYLPLNKVPPEIKKLRKLDGFSALAEEGKEETVIKYEKNISLFPATILARHSRLHDLNDIIRFNVGNWLHHVPESESQVSYFDTAENCVMTIECGRVVHVNLLVRLSNFNSESPTVRLKKFRLILNRGGLQRLEQVYSE